MQPGADGRLPRRQPRQGPGLGGRAQRRPRRQAPRRQHADARVHPALRRLADAHHADAGHARDEPRLQERTPDGDPVGAPEGLGGADRRVRRAAREVLLRQPAAAAGGVAPAARLHRSEVARLRSQPDPGDQPAAAAHREADRGGAEQSRPDDRDPAGQWRPGPRPVRRRWSAAGQPRLAGLSVKPGAWIGAARPRFPGVQHRHAFKWLGNQDGPKVGCRQQRTHDHLCGRSSGLRR